jgi:integrase
VSWELVSQAVADALKSLKALEAGETPARETRQRRAVPEDKLKAVRAKLKVVHQDMFDVMLLCGCRPGELASLTTGILDRSGELWRADLVHHKTAHQGKSRTLFFNVKAQAIMLKYLKADPDALLFGVSRDTFGEAVKRACEVAFGIPRNGDGGNQRQSSEHRR